MSVDLRAVIRGALLQTINEHGPITRATLESAAKRVNGAVRGRVQELERQNAELNQLIDEDRALILRLARL